MSVYLFLKCDAKYKRNAIAIPSQRAKSGMTMSHHIHDANRYLKKMMATTIATFSLFNHPLLAYSSEGSPKLSVFEEVWSSVDENFYSDTFNEDEWKKIKKDYEAKVQRGGDESALAREIVSKLGDKYTRLVDKKQFEALYKYDAIGVGLLFQTNPGEPMVVSSQPIPGSSGYAAGLQKGDKVYEIDGQSTDKLTALELLDRMSNDDSDSITIVYSKPGESERKTVSLSRSLERAANPVRYSIETLKDGRVVGYAKINEFNSKAVEGMEMALVAMNEANAEELVLDLRGNTGGGFQFALNIGGMFMDNTAVMASTNARRGESNVFRASYTKGVLWNKPIVLLTDALSASASEVLAGGLHDNCRAVLVGEKTFGKGKIQAVFGLQNGEGLIMTIAQYVTPRGTIIQSKGLTPDIPTPVTNAYMNFILGNIAPTPDVKSIDYNRVENLLNTCKSNL